MWCWKQVARFGLIALVVLGVSSVLVAGTTHPSYAQTSSSIVDPGNITDPGSGPKPGDPDGPTGDLPPPSAGTGRMVGSSTGQPNASTGIVPERRAGAWAQWKIALKLMLRAALIAY